MANTGAQKSASRNLDFAIHRGNLLDMVGQVFSLFSLIIGHPGTANTSNGGCERIDLDFASSFATVRDSFGQRNQQRFVQLSFSNR
jgi:hypothetical protein